MLILRGLGLVPLGGGADLFLLLFFLVPADFSFLFEAAVERCFVDGLGCALDLPLDGVVGAADSAGGVSVSICPLGMHLDGTSPLGAGSAGGFGVSICPPGMHLDGGSV